MKSSQHRGGIALLVALVVLTLLSILATTFAILNGVERSVSRNYVDDVRARLLAESGFHHALAGLEEVLRRPQGFLDPVPVTGAWRFDGRPVEFTSSLDGGTYAAGGDQYSVRVVDASGLLHLNDGVGGGPDGTTSLNLRRILNELGRVPSVGAPDLGDRILRHRPSGGWPSTESLRPFLSEAEFARVRPLLAAWSWVDSSVADPVPLSADPAVLAAYTVPYGRAGGRVTARQGHQCDAWGRTGWGRPLTWFQEWMRPEDPAPAVYGMDSLAPQGIALAARAPVNVNTAPREVLIALLSGLEGFFTVERRRFRPWTPRPPDLAAPPGGDGGVDGYAWLETRLPFGGPGATGADAVGWIYRTVPIRQEADGRARGGPFIPAEAVADAIIRNRKIPAAAVKQPWEGLFRSWPQFELFCDYLATPRGGKVAGRWGEGAGLLRDPRRIFFDVDDARGGRFVPSPLQREYASGAIADVLKSNFDPNLHLNETNPDRPLFRRVDKTDLVVASTEFCFTPMGVFEIESTGRVLEPSPGAPRISAVSRPSPPPLVQSYGGPAEASAKAGASSAGPGLQIVAERGIRASIRLFDAIRETSQADFYQGDLPEREGRWETNNNYGLETGPEPDNGPAPAENRWGGYVASPTLGGNEYLPGRHKEKGATVRTPPGGRALGSAMHAHFQTDFDLHHHPSGDAFRANLAGARLASRSRVELFANFPDAGETAPSPYGPADGSRWRLARDYRLGAKGGKASGPPPPAAMSDLRVDGGYNERHAAVGWWATQEGGDPSIRIDRGVAAFWFKPGWFPELTGRPRTLWSHARFHLLNPGWMNPSPNNLFFLPAHDSIEDVRGGPPGGAEAEAPAYLLGPAGDPLGAGRLRPMSLAYGFGASRRSGYGAAAAVGAGAPTSWDDPPFEVRGGVLSPTLAHAGHDHPAGQPGSYDYLRGHEWVHLVFAWGVPDSAADEAAAGPVWKLFVNGKLLDGSVVVRSPRMSDPAPDGGPPNWANEPFVRDGRRIVNPVRFGEPSTVDDGVHRPGAEAPFDRNFPADGTIDEFHLWTESDPETLDRALSLRRRGRYYAKNSVQFRSRPILPPSAAGEPAGAFERGLLRAMPPAGASAPSNLQSQFSKLKSSRRLLGASWSWRAEDLAWRRTAGAFRLLPVLHDHADEPADGRSLDLPTLESAVFLSAETPAAPAGLDPPAAARGFAAPAAEVDPLAASGYAAFTDPATGAPPVIGAGAELRYRATFHAATRVLDGRRVPNQSPLGGAVLQAAVVLDDVTLYFSRGEPEVLEWISLP